MKRWMTVQQDLHHHHLAHLNIIHLEQQQQQPQAALILTVVDTLEEAQRAVFQFRNQLQYLELNLLLLLLHQKKEFLHSKSVKNRQCM